MISVHLSFILSSYLTIFLNNHVIFQVEGDVFYEVCKDIPKDTELLVWYGDSYLQFMGVPVSLKETNSSEAQEEADCKWKKISILGNLFVFLIICGTTFLVNYVENYFFFSFILRTTFSSIV